MKHAPTLLALALLAIHAIPVLAQDSPGLFVAGGIGATYADNDNVEGATFDYDIGIPTASLALGYAFANGVELELESVYRFNDLEILELDGEVHTGTHDRVTAASLMVNAVYGFDVGSRLRPHVGVGVGATRIHYEITSADAGIEIVDDNDTTLALQAIAGFGIELTPRIRVTADYRYWRALSIDLRSAASIDFDTEYTSHSLTLGASYALTELPPRPKRTGLGARRRGLYTSLRGGQSFAHDANIDGAKVNFDAFDLGPAASIAVGYALKSNLRLELEAVYFDNPVDIIDFGDESAAGEVRARGDVTVAGVMGNVLYDFNLGSYGGSTVRPYVGFGIGAARYDYRVGVADERFVDDEVGALTLQLILGIGVGLTRAATFTFDYRYSGATSLKLTDPNGATIDTSYSVHAVMLGLRFALQ